MTDMLSSFKTRVLIESDWNLKMDDAEIIVGRKISINRIRLEFKGDRLEEYLDRELVLIESDWNLKYIWTA